MRVPLTFAVVLGLSVMAPVATALEPPRGPDTTVPYVVDDELHVGATVIPLADAAPDASGDHRLVGRTGSGWLVSQGWYDASGLAHSALQLVTATSSATIHVHVADNDVESTQSYRLNRDRTSVLEWNSFSGSTDARILDLAGAGVASRSLPSGTQVLDFAGNSVVFTGRDGTATRAWRIGRGVATLARHGEGFVDLGHRRMAVTAPRQRVALVGLEHPKRVLWRARFSPERFSPNGARLAGWALDARGRSTDALQIRRGSDGRLIRTFNVRKLRAGLPFSLTWDKNRAVVLEGVDGPPASSLRFLVRCPVGGACTVASEQGQDFTFAFETDGSW
ncbi:exported hypothetical protein [metagenome]|uniref:Uncharacterized protein n=1 Tax=metagenome TaxID=256318 RepID=A0A2P2BWT9_9ZZZZ